MHALWTSHDRREVAAHAAAEVAADIDAALDSVESVLLDSRDAIAATVAQTSIAHVPGLVPDWLCDEMNRQLSTASWIVPERVETAEGSWTIDLIDNSYPPLAASEVADSFSALCLSDAFLGLIRELTGHGSHEVVTTRRWVNRYGVGDSIAPHVDTTGDFQIMICLEAPEPTHGGRLVLDNGAAVDLQKGDLLVMAHAEVLHWTEPIAPGASSARATATCRYYVAGGRLPRSRVLPHTTAGPQTSAAGGHR